MARCAHGRRVDMGTNGNGGSPVERAEVEQRLSEEAAKLDAAHVGAHKFNNIRRYNAPSGANWTANFGVKGGNLHDAVRLGYMREVLERVQSELPSIKFDG